MTLRKTFTFNGHNSAEYGLFITGAAVHDGAAYDYEFIEIPGRNGDLILDNGRFHNLEVRYPAFVVDPAKMPAIRAWLLGARGYHQLTDDYNPTEYRMACFAYSLQADPFALSAVNFDLVFNCKPQRWQTAGEQPVTFAALYSDGSQIISADTIIAGTLFNTGQTIIEDYNSTAGSLFPDLVSVRFAGTGGGGAYTTYTRAQLASAMTWQEDHAELDLVAAVPTMAAGGYVSLVYSASPDAIIRTRSEPGRDWEETQIRASAIITNPTPYTAAPLITITISPGVNTPAPPAVTVGDVTVSSSVGFTGVLYVDSEIADSYIYDGDTKINANSTTVLEKGGTPTTDFPTLPAGETVVQLVSTTTISDTGRVGVAEVQIQPRWYTI